MSVHLLDIVSPLSQGEKGPRGPGVVVCIIIIILLGKRETDFPDSYNNFFKYLLSQQCELVRKIRDNCREYQNKQNKGLLRVSPHTTVEFISLNVVLCFHSLLFR